MKRTRNETKLFVNLNQTTASLPHQKKNPYLVGKNRAFMSIVDKTTIANVIAGFGVVSGVVMAAFMPEQVDSNILVAITMASLGYLFGSASPIKG